MARKLSRRELGMAALASSMLAQAQNREAGPVAEKLEDQTLDPVLWTRMRYESAPLKLGFRAGNRKQAEAWQKQLREKVTDLLGGFPAAKVPLNAQILEVKDFPVYRRERFMFTSRPGVSVAGYLLTPKKGNGPHATMVCVPGHGRGADDIVGIDEKGGERIDKAGYQHDFAIQAVEHGMAAVAIEPMAFGCRRDPKTKKKGAGTSACQPAAGAALLFGESMIGWRVYDVMRTIDWIETRKELDSSRVGCMGISGGGTCTLFATALEPRIKTAMVSGYLNTFRDCILSLSHCIDNYVPGILRWAEMYDVAGLIAPRPLIAESGTRDPIFPIDASKESFARVKKVYGVFDAEAVLEHEIFEGEHQFHGVRGLPFLARQLKVV
jgi:dienelactone hydrolase